MHEREVGPRGPPPLPSTQPRDPMITPPDDPSAREPGGETLRSARWALLLSVLVTTTGLATWSVRAATVRDRVPAVAPLPGLRADTLVPLDPGEPATAEEVGAEALEATRARVRDQRARTPAGDVDRWILSLSLHRRAEIAAMLRRKATYEPLILQTLARHEIPRDLIYLAMIESGYEPSATSPVGAAGVWQFMPRTARSFGLEVSSFVDERRDPIRSTDAAARYLAALHRDLGSWHLAAAAYNAGEGRLGRVLERITRREGGDDVLYWIIRPYLPRETREYVPKLLAAARIGNDPTGFGFASGEALPPLAFRELWTEGGVPLKEVARRTGTEPAAVQALNPHLVRGVTPPGRRWPVRIPLAEGDAGYAEEGPRAHAGPPSPRLPTALARP